MTQAATMTIEVDADVKAKLDQLASDTRRSAASLAAEAVSAYVEHERRIVEDIKLALAELEAGEGIPHNEAMAEIDTLIETIARSKA